VAPLRRLGDRLRHRGQSRLFITADGKPASPIGWPSGGQVGLHGAVNDWHTNKLGGGGFTVAAGALGTGTGPVQLP
jgi:hypothetical protein